MRFRISMREHHLLVYYLLFYHVHYGFVLLQTQARCVFMSTRGKRTARRLVNADFARGLSLSLRLIS